MSPPEDSTQLRRQIGLFKKLLQRYTSTSTSILKAYQVSPEAHQVDHLDNDELETLRQEISSVRKRLLNTHEKITKLHDEWSTLQHSDANESTIFDEYIAKYGDYRASITAAANQLEQLDYLMNALDQEYTKRKLHIPSDSSDSASHDDNVGKWNSAPSFALQSGLLPSSPAVPPDPTLLNFVDASILSKLDLPTFDGNLLDYPEFWARSVTLVDNKPQLDDTTKFSLLKSCLRGRALQSIQGLSLTAANYKIAVDILKTHYDDKVTMKHILFTKLAQLPACDPEGRQLPTFYNRMFSLVRQFCNGGDDSKETALGALLLNKLPVRVRSQIYDRTSNSHNVTPSELLHLLTDIVRKDSTLFKIEFHSRRSSEAKNVDYVFHSTTRSVRPPSNGTITRSTEKQHNPKKTGKSCPYCKSAFRGAMDCNVFTTTKQRWAQTKVLRLCHNCLSSAHITRECSSKYSCRYCSQRHHSSLCRQFEHQSPLRNLPSRLSSTTTNNQAKNDQQQRFRPSKLNSHTISVAEPTPQCAPVADISECMKQDATNPAAITYSSSQLLATASPTSQAALMCTEVSLFNPSDPSKRIAVTAFLDSGSSKSYITDVVADRLNLDTITMEDIVVSTFGSTSSLKLKCGNHNVGMVTTKGPKHLQVKSVPTITGNLLQIQINQEVSSGNSTFSQCKPSILIGNDYFWDVVLSDDFFYRRLPNGYRLLHTTIGDVIINEALDFNHVNYYTSVISNETDLDNPRNHDELCELVSNFWKLETIGITDDPTKSDDDECLNYFNDTITYDQRQNRYFVKLPFKSDPAQLPNNFSLAFSRLRSQVKFLQQRPDYLEKYHAVIKNQAELGIIEEVPSDHLSKPSHYLSHHGVVKKDGNDKKNRCVYDGSAKVTGQ
uniref:DUF1758 domain-containing protein n=1 Tax=Haemonchus contortus TaxID=6289 RepID=A0A7I4Z3P0_HAECO